MTADPQPRRLADSGALWFVVSAVGSVVGGWLTQEAGRRYVNPPPKNLALLLAGLLSILLAGFAAWKLARAGVYSWLLPLAAANLVLLQPGRADARTWRLEWGVMGLVWTLAAVLVFARLLRRSDELERRLHLEGAFYGLATGLVGSVVYALFETRLPELRGQWVAVALLLSWWVGTLATARRYRWRA
jgi:MFS family permease